LSTQLWARRHLALARLGTGSNFLAGRVGRSIGPVLVPSWHNRNLQLGLSCYVHRNKVQGVLPGRKGTMERERRRTPRIVFFAAAELLEEKSEVRVASRVSELSLHGCYLDMMNPFPADTAILLKIWTDENTVFQTKSSIIYSQPNMGAGVRFVDVDEKNLAVLRQWMEEPSK
jgi:hypothetical protein